MTAKPPARRLLRALPLSLLAVAVGTAACDLAADGVSAAGERTWVDTYNGHQIATRELPDGQLIAIGRQEPDSSMGYTGLTPYYLERRHAMVNGERVMNRVASHPIVVGVDAGSPAEQAGFREGDVLLAENGRDSREPSTEPLRPGMELTYKVRRDGRDLQLRLVAASLPTPTWPPTDAEFQEIQRRFALMESLSSGTRPR